MIERIRLDDDQEKYEIDIGDREVIVILCLDGVIEIKGRYEQNPYAVLNKYETWTLSTSYRQPTVRSVDPAGAEFLIVRYFRS
jgi:hypothetical protein